MERRTLLIAAIVACSGLGCLLSDPMKGGHRLELRAATEAEAEQAVAIIERRIEALNPWYGSVSHDGTAVTVVASNRFDPHPLLEPGQVGFYWESDGPTGRQLQDDLRIEERPFMGNEQIQRVNIGYDSSGMPYVTVQLVDDYHDTFRQVTSDNAGRMIAVVVDGSLLSSARVREAIPGGIVTISLPDENQRAAERVAMLLAAGPLPKLVLESTQKLE